MNLPPVLRIEPAASCNLRCIHCPTGQGLAPSGVMLDETFQRLIAQIQGRQFRSIVLYHGGEPLLNKRFVEMVRQVKPFARTTKTVTNGTLLQAHRINEILDCGLDIIEVSLDGASADENDRIRQGSRFDEIAENVRALVEARDKRRLLSPLVFIAHTQMETPETDTAKSPWPSDYLLKAFRGIDLGYKTTWAMEWPGMRQASEAPPSRNTCDHIVSTITVRWNGDVVPCCYDLVNQSVMGNIRRDNLDTIWNGAKYEALRRQIENYQPPELCQGCAVLGYER